MHNQRIFNAKFRYFPSTQVQRAGNIAPWELPDKAYIVMICPCPSGSLFIKDMPRPNELVGWTINDFLNHGGQPSSIVCLIFNGVLRYINKRWCMIIDCAGRDLTVPLIPRSHLGLIQGKVPSDAVVANVESYVRSILHKQLAAGLIEAGYRTSDHPDR